MFTAIVSLHHRKIHTVYEMKQPFVRPQVIDLANMSCPHSAESQESKITFIPVTTFAFF